MIARIHFTLLSEPTQATLDDDGKWSCDDETIQRSIDLWWANAAGRSCLAKLSDVALFLKGTVEIAPSASAKSNRFEDAAKKIIDETGDA